MEKLRSVAITNGHVPKASLVPDGSGPEAGPGPRVWAQVGMSPSRPYTCIAFVTGRQL
jgi:hypothetical protein